MTAIDYSVKLADMNYDVSIIRPELKSSDIKFVDAGIGPNEKKKIKRALRTLHNLEAMAVNIYKYQITKKHSELNRQLIAAMANEMTHLQDFQIALYEFGLKPSVLRFFWRIVGFVFGLSSKLLGRKMILKTGIWTETKATDHYAELLDEVDWPMQIKKVIEKNAADEQHHIDNWLRLSSQYDNKGK